MAELVHSIRYPFAIDRGLGILREENVFNDHVVQLIKQILFTAPGERINRPDFGCGVHRMVFEPAGEAGANLLQVTIVQALERWLGDVITVVSVNVKAIEETLGIGIVYVVKARQERRFLNLEVTL